MQNSAEIQRWNSQCECSAGKTLRTRWHSSISYFTNNANDAEAWYEQLRLIYTNPARQYHNLDHIKQILDWITIVREQFISADELLAYQLAAWFHDAVYDTHRVDNEELSADYLESSARDLHLPRSITKLAREMILSTKTHETSSPAAAAFCDCDLAILGSPLSVYEEYRQAIRGEYSWVPEDEYRSGRSKVLRRFLDRPAIYATPAMHQWLEQTARRNLAGELAELCVG